MCNHEDAYIEWGDATAHDYTAYSQIVCPNPKCDGITEADKDRIISNLVQGVLA